MVWFFLVPSKYVIELAEFPECCVRIEFVLNQPRGVFCVDKYVIEIAV